MTTSSTNNNGGRPSKYDPSYCELYTAMSEQGLYGLRIAAKMKVTPKTLYNWRKNHPEFDEAVTQGCIQAADVYLRQCDKAIFNDKCKKDFKDAMFMANLILRPAREAGLLEGAEELEYVLQKGNNNLTINGDVNNNTLNLDNFSKQDIEAKIAEIAGRLKNSGVLIDQSQG